MGVTGDVHEHVAEHTVHQPGRRIDAVANLCERDFQFVKRIVACFVDAGMLTGRSDEQAGKQVGQRRVVMPVAHETAQQIWSSQEWALARRRAADDDVIATTGAGMAAIEHELLGGEP